MDTTGSCCRTGSDCWLDGITQRSLDGTEVDADNVGVGKDNPTAAVDANTGGVGAAVAAKVDETADGLSGWLWYWDARPLSF